MSSSSRPLLPTSSFDLKKITEFNPSLIYGFDPEPMLNENASECEKLFNSTGQFIDMYNAYHFSQTNVLSILREKTFSKISPEEILEMIDKIHGHIAVSLAKDQGGVAGKYTSDQVGRWHYGWIFSIKITDYLTKKINKKDFYDYLNQNSIDIGDAEKFAQLFKKFSDNDSFIQAIHQDKLPLSDRGIVDKFVKFPMSPEKFPAAMLEFAKSLIVKIQKCDANNIDSVVDIAFFVFNQIVQIHPYFNANGRLACNVMNVILRYLNKPSILLRYPSEKGDKSSSYSRAIEAIDTNPKILLSHIKARLNTPVFANPLLHAFVEAQVELCNTIQNLKKTMKSSEVDKMYALKKELVLSDLTLIMPFLLCVPGIETSSMRPHDAKLGTGIAANKAINQELNNLIPKKMPNINESTCEMIAYSMPAYNVDSSSLMKIIDQAKGKVKLDKETKKIMSFEMPSKNLIKEVRENLGLDRVRIKNLKNEQIVFLRKISGMTIEPDVEQKNAWLFTFPLIKKSLVKNVIENWDAMNKATLIVQSVRRGTQGRKLFFNLFKEKTGQEINALEKAVQETKLNIINSTHAGLFAEVKKLATQAESAVIQIDEKKTALITKQESLFGR